MLLSLFGFSFSFSSWAARVASAMSGNILFFLLLLLNHVIHEDRLGRLKFGVGQNTKKNRHIPTMSRMVLTVARLAGGGESPHVVSL